MVGNGTGGGNGDRTPTDDRTLSSASSQIHDRLATEAWTAPPLSRDSRRESNAGGHTEQRVDESAQRIAKVVSDEKTIQRASDLLYNAARGDNRDGRMSEFAQIRSDVYKQIRKEAKSDSEAREMMWQFDDNVSRSLERSSRGRLKVDLPANTTDGQVTTSVWDSNRLDWRAVARTDSNPSKDLQDKSGKQAESSEHNYDAQVKQIRQEIRNDAHSTTQMSETIQKILDGIPREDRAGALMQAFHHFGNTKYIQTADGEASITASAIGGKIGIQTPEVKIDVPEDKTVIHTKDVPEAVKKVADYLTKEGDAVRAHAVLNGYPPGERAEILRQAVLRANSEIGGNGTALIVEQLPGGKERLSVAVLHPASGKDFDAKRDVSLSIIVPSDQSQAQKTDGKYQHQVDALKEAIMKWDGVEANRILQSIPREDRLNVMAQASHKWDCSEYHEQADGTAKVGAGRGIMFPMEEGPWVERDRVNVVRMSVPGDQAQIKPKDAAQAAQMIAFYLNAHDGIYAHKVLNSFPPNERQAILQQSVDYWNQNYNKAKDIPGTQLQMKTESLPDGQERLRIDDTLSILVPAQRKR